MEREEELVELLRWFGSEIIELKTALIAIKGLLVEKDLLTREEIEEAVRASHEMHFAVARQVGTSAFDELEDLIRRFRGRSG